MSSSIEQQSYDIEPPFTPPNHGNMPVSDWVDHYGLVPGLVPFDYRDYDPLDAVSDIRDILDSKPQTAARVTLSEIRDAVGFTTGSVYSLEALMEIAGSWRISDHFSDRSAWANPNYVHGVETPVTDADERRATLRRLAGYGTLTHAAIAPRFGLANAGSLRRWVSRHDIPWSEWRIDGVRKMARTAHLTQRWTDHSETDIADALDTPAGTLKGWIHNHARTDSSFDVPRDPSQERWFAGGDRR